MSNEHTHDTNEPTGARLTDAQLGAIAGRARGHKASTNDVHALLADRAALVAEVARLQASLHSSHQMIGEIADELTRVEDQNLAMRPLVEALAGGEATEYYGIGTEDTNCNLCSGREDRQTGHVVHEADCPVTHARALVATWQPPAAPTPDVEAGK